MRGIAASTRHESGENKLESHILNYKYEAERATMKWGEIINPKISPIDILHKAVPPTPPQTVPLNGDQLFKSLIPWETFLIKIVSF